MANHRLDSGRGTPPAPQDGRLDAPAFHRNNGIITAQLRDLLGGRDGDVVELGSGTGQHAMAFARAMPDMTWWPSDANADRLTSIDAWCRHSGLANLRPASVLDVTQNPWAPDPPGVPLEAGLAAVVAINLVHIAPWQAAVGIFRGAGRHLGAGGVVLLYGPFKRDGAHTAPSNAAFDAGLRASDPAWGVRDTADLGASARDHGLTLRRALPVAANNMILVFEQSP
ncbi:MAG: DUF938 domain-containing protein [Alphaproteobacteria bacterium]|nr:DUF938 domain-containing protein [Alphaproteobacteria bacterium]MCZ6608931.1 DUF938 domain-containing protein [Alphaproteobacteria bacterium]